MLFNGAPPSLADPTTCALTYKRSVPLTVRVPTRWYHWPTTGPLAEAARAMDPPLKVSKTKPVPGTKPSS